MPEDVVVEGKVLEWGNSFGIRVKKSDLLEAGIASGTEVVLHLTRKPSKIDLKDFPFLRGGKADDSERHDALFAEALLADKAGRKHPKRR